MTFPAVLVFVLSACTADAVVLYLNVTPSENEGLSGSSRNFFCDYNGSDKPVVLYQFVKDGVNITEFSKSPFLNSIHPNLIQLKPADSGNYTCLVEKKDGTLIVSNSFQLKVFLLILPKTRVVLEGRDVNLTCVELRLRGGQEENIPSYTWKRNNVIINGETSKSLFLRNVSRLDNENNYTCIPHTQYVEINETRVRLIVFYIDKPHVTGFISNYQPEGRDMHLTCNKNTDLIPKLYKWYKNDVEIMLNASLLNDKLTFSNLSKFDTANYTCSHEVLQYPEEPRVGSLKYSLFVAYLSQPRVSFLEGNSTYVEEGSKVALVCSVDDYFPNLNLTYLWTTPIGAIVGKSPELRLDSIRRTDTEFICDVTGQTLLNRALLISKEYRQQITVYYTATDIRFTNHTAINVDKSYVSKIKRNSTFFTTCLADKYGKPEAVLYLFKGIELVKNGTAGRSLNFTINSVQHADTANYTCQAVNSVGMTSNRLELLVTDVPGAPEDLIITETTDRKISFSWKQPSFTGFYEIIVYNIVFGPKYADLKTIQVGSWKTSEYFQNLMPGRTYIVKVQAVNELGAGPFTNVISSVTLIGDYPSDPVDVQQILGANLPQQVVIQWKAPVITNGKLLDYKLCFRKVSGRPDEICVTVNATSELQYTKTVTRLETYTQYSIELRARNANGFGDKATITAWTREDVPAQVRNLTFLANQTSIQFSWETPEHLNGILKYYLIEYKSSSNVWIKGCSTKNLSCEVKYLTPGTTYLVRVITANQQYNNSQELNVTTMPMAPPPLDKVLPFPAKEKITSTSFVINIVKFNESNGALMYYDVFVMRLQDNVIPKQSPITYTESFIKKYRVGRIVNPVENQEFVIGGGETSKRKKKRSLGEPSNPQLEPDKYYVAFVRGYITQEVYQTTPWYKQVKTLVDDRNQTDGLSGGEISGIVIAIILLVVLTVVVLFCFVRSKKHRFSTHVESVRMNQHKSDSFYS